MLAKGAYVSFSAFYFWFNVHFSLPIMWLVFQVGWFLDARHWFVCSFLFLWSCFSGVSMLLTKQGPFSRNMAVVSINLFWGFTITKGLCSCLCCRESKACNVSKLLFLFKKYSCYLTMFPGIFIQVQVWWLGWQKVAIRCLRVRHKYCSLMCMINSLTSVQHSFPRVNCPMALK